MKVAVFGTSGGGNNQSAAPQARMVKVFNTVGHGLMYKPKLQSGIKSDMFICGNDEGAKSQTKELLVRFGWETIDLGGMDCAHYLEAMCLVWVISAARS
jgi:predicted dinucleotide-binding enzyme